MHGACNTVIGIRQWVTLSPLFERVYEFELEHSAQLTGPTLSLKDVVAPKGAVATATKQQYANYAAKIYGGLVLVTAIVVVP